MREYTLTKEQTATNAAWKHWAEIDKLRDGEPCSHPGCLSYVTEPCEGCHRIAGRKPLPTRQDIIGGVLAKSKLIVFPWKWTDLVELANKIVIELDKERGYEKSN